MVRFLNDVTGNHLLLYKVVLTSVVFALAGVQVFFLLLLNFAAPPFALTDHKSPSAVKIIMSP